MNAEEILREMLSKLLTENGEADGFIAAFKRRVDQPLDGKFSGYVWRNRDGAVEDQFVVFVPRDCNLPHVLNEYLECCKCDCGDEQLRAVERLIRRVVAWQQQNSVKIPDAEPGECK